MGGREERANCGQNVTSEKGIHFKKKKKGPKAGGGEVILGHGWGCLPIMVGLSSAGCLKWRKPGHGALGKVQESEPSWVRGRGRRVGSSRLSLAIY